MNIMVLSFKALRKSMNCLLGLFYTPMGKLILLLNGAEYSQNLKIRGAIKVLVTRRGTFKMGENIRINSGNNYNIIGRQQKCTFWVEGELLLQDNVGISASAIICNHKITIGRHVVIGGNTVIYDTDFHSLNPVHRGNPQMDKDNTKWAPVLIGDNVFIGAHTTILKGVTIGNNSVVGACSVVTKDIPSNEVWAGNPAVFIRKIQ